MEKVSGGWKAKIEEQDGCENLRSQHWFREDRKTEIRRKKAAKLADPRIQAKTSRPSRRPRERVREEGEPRNRHKKAARDAEARIGSGRMESRKRYAKKLQKSQIPE